MPTYRLSWPVGDADILSIVSIVGSTQPPCAAAAPRPHVARRRPCNDMVLARAQLARGGLELVEAVRNIQLVRAYVVVAGIVMELWLIQLWPI